MKLSFGSCAIATLSSASPFSGCRPEALVGCSLACGALVLAVLLSTGPQGRREFLMTRPHLGATLDGNRDALVDREAVLGDEFCRHFQFP
jgi:hypothetical protein